MFIEAQPRRDHDDLRLPLHEGCPAAIHAVDGVVVHQILLERCSEQAGLELFDYSSPVGGDGGDIPSHRRVFHAVLHASDGVDAVCSREMGVALGVSFVRLGGRGNRCRASRSEVDLEKLSHAVEAVGYPHELYDSLYNRGSDFPNPAVQHLVACKTAPLSLVLMTLHWGSAAAVAKSLVASISGNRRL